jgi:hypothetical protein
MLANSAVLMPAKFVDFTLAPDAETAEERWLRHYQDRLRDRLFAIRDDL